MSSYTRIKIILTLLISMVVAYLLYNWLSTYQTDTTVVISSVAIKEREVIKAEMLVVKNVRAKDRDIIAPKSAKTAKELIGTLTKTNIPAGKYIDTVTDVVKLNGESVALDEYGEPIVDKEISQSYFIKSNQRLIAINLESASALNNMLRKGDFVDIIGSYETKDGGKLTLIVAQKVEVHDVATMLDEEKGKESQNIVLKVDVKQAGDLSWLKNTGKVDLVLSSAQAKSEVVTPITESAVFNRSLGSSN